MLEKFLLQITAVGGSFDFFSAIISVFNSMAQKPAKNAVLWDYAYQFSYYCDVCLCECAKAAEML